MQRTVFLLALAATMPLLAGCLNGAGGGPAADPFALPASAMQAGGFYAFQHRGGGLVFAVGGTGAAEVVLYGADDTRIGRIAIGGDDQAAGRFVLDDVGGGQLVIEVIALDGTLDVRSAGAPIVSFHELGRHVERHVLMQAQQSPFGALGLPSGPPANATLDLHLLRAPSSLRLLSRGSFQALDVRIDGVAGPVLEAQASGPGVATVLGGFEPIQSTDYRENVRDGDLTAHVRADRFEGVLLLEAESFSRAQAIMPVGAAMSHLAPRFNYGELPEQQPVSFQVRAGTTTLFVRQDSSAANACHRASGSSGCGNLTATVALFGPDDGRVGTLVVPVNTTIAVPISRGGEWVAVLLDGQASLGADTVPGDFELHPLTVRETHAPDGAASNQDGTYAQGEDGVAIDGVPFALELELVSNSRIPFSPSGPGLSFAQCGPSSLAVRQAGETVAIWGIGSDFGQARQGARLSEGELTIAHDDFGPDCERDGLVVLGYARQSAS